MKKKINPNKMSPEELAKYASELPERVPPKWSSAGWLAAIGLFGIIGAALRLRTSPSASAWGFLGAGIIALVGAGYLAYKILTFWKNE